MNTPSKQSDSLSRKAIRQTFEAQLKDNDLALEMGWRWATHQLAVRARSRKSGKVFVTLLCPSSHSDDELRFPVERTTVEHMRDAVPWQQRFEAGSYTAISIPESGFLAIPVPETESDFWLLAMDRDIQKALFSPIAVATPDAPETEFALKLTADIDGMPAKQVLSAGLNNFKCLTEALAKQDEAADSLIPKFTLKELEDELRGQLQNISQTIGFHCNVAMAAHLTGDQNYIPECHNNGNGRPWHWLDYFYINDLEDYAITFQVRRLYALVFENRWDNLISDLHLWRNIDLAIWFLDHFVDFAAKAGNINYDSQPLPSRLRALSLMAKARVRLLGGVPLPFPEFAALAQISERSMSNLVSKNGALAGARVSFAEQACIDPLKALKWIDRRPLFHRTSDTARTKDGSPFELVTNRDDALLELIAEIFKKMTATLADGKTINDYFSEHGYSEAGANLLRRSLKGDHDWMNSEEEDDTRTEFMQELLDDIERHYPDLPDRKKWIWAIHMDQYYG